MQVQAKTSPLRVLRKRYGFSQEGLAHLAGLTVNTYRSAEYGENVSYTTATKILDALNTVKRERYKDTVLLVLDDLGLKIV